MEDEKKPESEFNLVVMIKKAGNDANVKIISHAPIFRDEIGDLVRAIQSTLELAAKHREGPTPSIKPLGTEEKERLIRTIGKLVEERGREIETLDRSLEDKGPSEPGVMTEEEREYDLAERHGVDLLVVRRLRERIKDKLKSGTTDKEIAEQGAEWGIPKTTVFALVEDLLEGT
jgi:hypothetical protein